MKTTTWSTVYTHDDGSFKVVFTPKRIRVSKKIVGANGFYKYEPLFTLDKFEHVLQTKPLPAKEQKFYGIFDPGNAVLIQLPKKGQRYQYMFIGNRIVTFITMKPVEKFYSPIGNGLPYSFAVTGDTTYLLNIGYSVAIKNKDLYYKKGLVDAYFLFDEKMNELKRKAKPIKFKIIQNTLF